MTLNLSDDFGTIIDSWFTPNGCEIWAGCCKDSPVARWQIVEGGESGIQLQPLEVTACPPSVFPWQSFCGYKVTDDGWVLSPTQKRLLWLPHHWRSVKEFWTWSGRFLGLKNSELPEVVILEFFE